MDPSQEDQEHKPYLLILSSMVLILGFCLFYYVAWYKIDLKNILKCQISNKLIYDRIFSLSMMIGVSLTFLAISLRENNRRLKYLVFSPVSIFFGALFLIYSIDYINDNIIETAKPILSFIITCGLSCIIYLVNLSR